MGLAAWGYGTGATTAAAHPFSLTIQGIDMIDAVPRDSISVSTSLASNATMDFTIEDRDNSIVIPSGYADVLLTEHAVASALMAFEPTAFEPTAFEVSAGTVPTDQILFSGLIIGTEITSLGIGRMIGVRCVDYGYLLDSRNFHPPLAWGGGSTGDVDPIVQRYCAAGLPGPITAMAASPSNGSPSGDRRVSLPGWILGAGQTEQGGTLRGALGNLADNFYNISLLPDYMGAASDVAIYVDPERRLNVWPLTGNAGAAPKTIVETAPAANEVNAENVTAQIDYTQVRSHIWITDSGTEGSDYSLKVAGSVADTNGYEIEGSGASLDYDDWDNPSRSGWVRLGPADSARIRGSFSIIGTTNWRIGQLVTITNAGCGLLADTFLIHAVSTDFLGGSVRRCRVEFGGIRASASRATRTLIARASA